MRTNSIYCLLMVAVAMATFHGGYSKKNLAKSKHTYEDILRNDEIEVEFNDVGSGEISTEDPLAEDAGSCPPVTTRHTDKYIDKVLREVRPKIPDPAFLPERIGRFHLFNGTLSGLDTVRRSGPALTRCTDSTFSFLVPTGFKNLTGHYSWEMDTGRGFPVFRGMINMFIGRLNADVLYTRQRNADVLYTGQRNAGSGLQKARVEKLTISRLDGVKVDFQGLGPLNRVASRLTGLVTRVFNKGVSRALEGPVRNAINKELKNVEKYEFFYF